MRVSGKFQGATIPTTPTGSGTVKSKYGPATAFTVPVTCAILSAQPAYQTHVSIAAATSFVAARLVIPVTASSSASCADRPSIISATR